MGQRMQFDRLKRREVISLLSGAAAAWALTARAQQSDRMRRIGVLMSYAQTDPEGQRYVAKLLEALEQMGWVQGRNLQIELRWGGGDRDRIQRQAAELAELKPDLILGQATPAVAALHRTTRTIPIVFVNVSDPIGSGFVESLPRPGGNMTGFSNFEAAMGANGWSCSSRLRRTSPASRSCPIRTRPRKQEPICRRSRALLGRSDWR